MLNTESSTCFNTKHEFSKLPQLADFPLEEVTPAVLLLLEICHQQREEIQGLRDEIVRLKGQKPRAQIRPSKLEGGDKKDRGGPRGGQGQQSKTSRLKIHETVPIRPDGIPLGSRFKGYQDFTLPCEVVGHPMFRLRPRGRYGGSPPRQKRRLHAHRQ